MHVKRTVFLKSPWLTAPGYTPVEHFWPPPLQNHPQRLEVCIGFEVKSEFQRPLPAEPPKCCRSCSLSPAPSALSHPHRGTELLLFPTGALRFNPPLLRPALPLIALLSSLISLSVTERSWHFLINADWTPASFQPTDDSQGISPCPRRARSILVISYPVFAIPHTSESLRTTSSSPQCCFFE